MPKNVLKKASALLLSAVLLITAVPFAEISAAGGTPVASFGKSGVWKWKWTYCDSYQTLKDTGFLNETFSNRNSVSGKYTMVFTDRNLSSVFASKPPDGDDNWIPTGSVGSVDWFDNEHSPFITNDRNSYVVAVSNPSSDAPANASSTVRLFVDPDKKIKYSGGTVQNCNSDNLKGLENDGSVEWDYGNNDGEQFTIYFDNSTSTPDSIPSANYPGCVSICEGVNRNWLWRTDGSKLFEEKGNKDKSGFIFKLWVGHYEEMYGLSDGEYKINSGNTVTADDDVCLIASDATLTVEKNAVLYVKGHLYVEGNLINYGTVIVEKGGEIVIGQNGSYGNFFSYGGKTDREGNVAVAQGGGIKFTCNVDFSRKNSLIELRYSQFCVGDGNLTGDGELMLRKGTVKYSSDGSGQEWSTGYDDPYIDIPGGYDPAVPGGYEPAVPGGYDPIIPGTGVTPAGGENEEEKLKQMTGTDFSGSEVKLMHHSEIYLPAQTGAVSRNVLLTGYFGRESVVYGKVYVNGSPI